MLHYEEGVFTDKQLDNFCKYKRVQESNEYNMLAPQAMAAVGCNREEYVFILQNYEALKTACSRYELAKVKKNGSN